MISDIETKKEEQKENELLICSQLYLNTKNNKKIKKHHSSNEKGVKI